VNRVQAETVAIRFDYPGRLPAIIHVLPALDFLARLRGLIGRPLPVAHSGLWIEPCAGIHTFGMREPIDVVFVSRDLRVRRIDEGVPPGRLRSCRRSHAVVEMQAGQARQLGILLGSRVTRVDVSSYERLQGSILGLSTTIGMEVQP